jgi:hypothetical protein
MQINCQMLARLRILMVAGACFLSTLPNAFAEAAANRLEHLHHASTSVAHAMSTAQLLSYTMAKRAMGRPETQFLRDLNLCENQGGINFGEARWRLQAVDASARLEELANAEKLFGILLEAARQWNGTADDAFNVIDALGVLTYQLEKLSVGLGRMSDEELATLLQRGSNPPTSASAAPLRPKDIPDLQTRSRSTTGRDQNL